MFSLVEILLVGASLLVLAQALFALYMMCFTWEHPERLEAGRGPRSFHRSNLSFTVLVPAREEEAVIFDTVLRIWSSRFPLPVAEEDAEAYREAKERQLEIVVICHEDDAATIAEARRAAAATGSESVRVVTFSGTPVNKPRGLNVGLAATSHDVIAVFDAEDDVDADVLNVVATVMERDGVGIVQAGVQLMNFTDHWFSLHNCLEYYFWFKSRLHFHAQQGMIPLGGNTVFVRRTLLEQVGGWDDACLTEDADLGVRLSALGEPIKVVYDADRVTREETPSDTSALIRQRTRWHQGFLQVLQKGDWRRLPSRRQRLLAAYTFAYPFLQLPVLALWPLAIVVGAIWHVSILVAMLTFLPLYALLFQFLVTLIGAGMFSREYGERLPIRTFLMLAVSFLPYQWILTVSSARALRRELAARSDWEKTAHVGAHRRQDRPAQAATSQVVDTEPSGS
jgi:cellulose synthase/poly-beta-1,6-N-acetylglucosamine synthase-like glycosyltransferase